MPLIIKFAYNLKDILSISKRMGLVRKILNYIIFMIIMPVSTLLPACSADDDEAGADTVVPQVIFLFSPGGLGDLGYNDCILSGVQQFKKAHPGIDVFMYSPPSLEVAERIFTDWLKRPESDIPVVFVFASSDYEPLAERYIAMYSLTSNKRLLIFESMKDYGDERIYTFQISMYGASFLAGKTAAECAGGKGSMVLLGSSSDSPITAARDGFADGYGREYDLEYLAEDWTGFIMAPEAYRKMGEWSRKYGFVFPVAGGSNIGIYRYSREYEDSPYLAGMDVDQSGYSEKITGSLVKHLDRLILVYLEQWLRDGTMPASRVYGLESGYVDWALAPLYESRFREVVRSSREEAVRKEKEYYEKSD